LNIKRASPFVRLKLDEFTAIYTACQAYERLKIDESDDREKKTNHNRWTEACRDKIYTL
jgi:hypothetical protein